MPSSLSFRLESDPSIYGYRHLLKTIDKNYGCNDTEQVNIPKTIFYRPKCFHVVLRLFGSYKYRFVLHSIIVN